MHCKISVLQQCCVSPVCGLLSTHITEIAKSRATRVTSQANESAPMWPARSKWQSSSRKLGGGIVHSPEYKLHAWRLRQGDEYGACHRRSHCARLELEEKIFEKADAPVEQDEQEALY
jgi:hypothetical protein